MSVGVPSSAPLPLGTLSPSLIVLELVQKSSSFTFLGGSLLSALSRAEITNTRTTSVDILHLPNMCHVVLF